MNVVEATAKDIPAIIQLNEEVQQIHVDLFPEFFKVAEPQALQQFYTAWVAAEHSSILLAQDNNQIAGYLAYKIIQRPENAFAYARNSICTDWLTADTSLPIYQVLKKGTPHKYKKDHFYEETLISRDVSIKEWDDFEGQRRYDQLFTSSSSGIASHEKSFSTTRLVL